MDVERIDLLEGDLRRGWRVSIRWQCYFESLTDGWTDQMTGDVKVNEVVCFLACVCVELSKDSSWSPSAFVCLLCLCLVDCGVWPVGEAYWLP
jgi:hypothetical protein